MAQPSPLDERFRGGLRALGLHGTGARVLVALSGGADSVVLLHLLRFHAGDAGIEVLAAHFDHAMRPGSAADARWVAGLCSAWEIPLAVSRAERRLRSEDDARRARYAFLRAAMREAGATHLATAHHADDQAETVLFRALRGTGLAGLAGIPASDATGLVRPLLPFWRRELRAWARAHGLRWRRDPSNESAGPARNRIRHRLLPLLERTVAPGARRSLVRLAALAREDAAAWEALLGRLEGEAVREEADGVVVLVRRELAGYDSPVAARLLRRVLRRLGSAPDRAGTRRALQFITAAPSGRELSLSGGVRIRTEFDTARIERAPAEVPPDEPLLIDGGVGEGRATIGGARLRVRWTADDGAPDAAPRWSATLAGAPRFPLTLRGRRPGDRIRLHAGSRPLKKLLGDVRVPRSARDRLPVLADAGGAVLWVAGIAQAAPTLAAAGEPALRIDIYDDGEWLTPS